MLSKWRLLLLLVVCLTSIPSAFSIYDPLNVFCGSENCYDVLGLSKDASIKQVKKAFRTLSLTHHPDKSREANATEVFRVISKAYEVLSGNESRALFDYYLAHPTDYFRVSGQHYYRQLPHSDLRVIFTVVLLLLSWFFHAVQRSKYERVVRYLKTAAMEHLPVNQGGSLQTLELYRQACAEYDETIVTMRKNGQPVAGVKREKDPLFEKIVEKHARAVEIEGGYRKPVWQDLLIVRLVMSPLTIFQWIRMQYRIYYAAESLTAEEKLRLARESVGVSLWEEGLSETERADLVARSVWRYDVYQEWRSGREAAERAAVAATEQQALEQEEALLALAKGKKGKKARALAQQALRGRKRAGEDGEYVE